MSSKNQTIEIPAADLPEEFMPKFSSLEQILINQIDILERIEKTLNTIKIMIFCILLGYLVIWLL